MKQLIVILLLITIPIFTQDTIKNKFVYAIFNNGNMIAFTNSFNYLNPSDCWNDDYVYYNKEKISNDKIKYTNGIESIIYRLKGYDLSIKFKSKCNDGYIYRINFIGNNNYKAITSWDVYNNELYRHIDKNFNEKYPYPSKEFLIIDKNTIFYLYHEGKLIYKISDISNPYFFYKNCTGDECFTFGKDSPYKDKKRMIQKKFECKLTYIK